MSYLDRKETSLIPTFIVASTLLQTILFLIVTITFGKIDRIASSKTPNLVELADGTTARTIPVAYNERSPIVISAFVGKTLVGLMSWNSVLQTLNADNFDTFLKPQLDEGVQIGERKVTTATWAAGFALSEDFRATFLTELAKLTPTDVFTGKTQSLLIVRELSQPHKIGNGQWRQNLVSNLVIFENGKPIGRAIPFNKTIFVRAINTPLLPKNATDLQTTTYKARRDGLEIYKIQELAQ